MPQLRCAMTSALIAEGDPWHLCLIAERLGRDECLFDGVNSYLAGELQGDVFDADAVLRAHAEELAGLEAAVADARDASSRRRLAAIVKARRAAIDAAHDAASAADAVMMAARAKADL